MASLCSILARNSRTARSNSSDIDYSPVTPPSSHWWSLTCFAAVWRQSFSLKTRRRLGKSICTWSKSNSHEQGFDTHQTKVQKYGKKIKIGACNSRSPLSPCKNPSLNDTETLNPILADVGNAAEYYRKTAAIHWEIAQSRTAVGKKRRNKPVLLERCSKHSIIVSATIATHDNCLWCRMTTKTRMSMTLQPPQRWP